MRTKQEIINFLESKLGTKVPCVGNSSLDGQCVTLVKSLMEFLGVPDPYKTRGHAKDCINSYLSEGIADKGAGFISVFSNKNMGGGYGHVWCNAGEGNGTYYESNGAKALTVTKGKTYSYDNVCNFDKYIKQDSNESESETMTDDQKGRENGNKFFNNIKNNINAKEIPQDIAIWLQNDIDNVSNEINQCYNDKKSLDDEKRKLENEIKTLTSQLESKTADFEASQKVLVEEKEVLITTAKETLDKQAADYEKKITALELTVSQLKTNINTIEVEKEYTLKELLIKLWEKIWERI